LPARARGRWTKTVPDHSKFSQNILAAAKTRPGRSRQDEKFPVGLENIINYALGERFRTMRERIGSTRFCRHYGLSPRAPRAAL